MSFFDNLLADIDKRNRANSNAPVPQKRKREASDADNQDHAANQLKIEVPEVSPFYGIPYDRDVDLKQVHGLLGVGGSAGASADTPIFDDKLLKTYKTPFTYGDGPRSEYQYGEITPYEEHANSLQSKLDEVITEMRRQRRRLEDNVFRRANADLRNDRGPPTRGYGLARERDRRGSGGSR
jgi:hypothetical protein